MTEHRHIEKLTADEDTELRLQSLVDQDYAIMRALKSQGASITSRGGHDYVISNPAAVGFKPPPPDHEHPDLALPRILARAVYTPLNGRTLTPLEVFDRFMKTPKKRREFVLGCTRAPMLPVFTVIKAGAELERLGVATAHTTKLAEEMALDKAGAQPGEKVQAVRIECRDRALAMEIVEAKADALPWATVELRPDGGLFVGWHGGRLSREEQDRLKDQESRDRRAKRERRDKVIRSMQREPL